MGGGKRLAKPAAKPKSASKAAASWKRPKKIPPPASRPPAPKPLVEPGVVVLAPDIRDTFARVQYHAAVKQWEPLVPPGLESATLRIAWHRIEHVFSRLGPVPNEVVAAWAIGGEPEPVAGDYTSKEDFSPEGAVLATAAAFDGMHDEPNEGFIALRSTGTRDEYEALLNEAVGYEAGGLPHIGSVQFDRDEGGFTVSLDRPITDWLVEMYAGELSLDVPDAFIAVFQVIIEG